MRMFLNFCAYFKTVSSCFNTMKQTSMEKKPGSIDNFTLLRFLLKMGGISLNKKENVIFKMYSILILSFNLFPFLQFLGVPRYLVTDKDIFEFVLFEMVALIIVIKAGVMLAYRISMGSLLEKLQTGLLRPNSVRGGDVEENLIKKCVARTQRQNMIYVVVVSGTTGFALLDSIIWRLTSTELTWRYEYGPFTMFNTSYSPNYDIAFLYQNIAWVMLGFIFVASELFIVVVLAHITYQLRVLQNSIRRIVFNSYLRMLKDQGLQVLNVSETSIDPSKIPWKYFQLAIADTVKYHLAIIEIAEETEKVFNILVLLVLLSAILIIGGFSYRFERVHIGGIFSQFGEIGLICYWGNEVSLESRNVLDACYDVNFIGADVRFQKSLFLIMERSKRPIIFTAGKFSTLTLGSFISIARAAYSFLLILRRVA